MGRISAVLPYVLGSLNLLCFNVLFRIYRGTFLGGDSGEFLRIADALRSGALLANPDNAKPLGYPLMLALLGGLPGSTVTHALVLNAACYLVTIAMIGAIARLLNCPPAGARFAQVVFSLVPNTAAWATLVLSDTMAMALLTCSFWVYLRILRAAEREARIRDVLLLGVLLGGLSVTRTEYVLLLPLVSLLFCIPGLRPLRSVYTAVSLLWVSSLPILMLQPVVSGWHRGLASFIPPNQSAFVDLWRYQYDLEFTQFRFQRLPGLAQLATELEDVDLPAVRERIRALKYSETSEAPIDDAFLDQAYADIRRIRELVRTHGLTLAAAYRVVTLDSITRHPGTYLARAARRFFLYLTSADLEWPPAHPAHWIYTVVIRPLTGLGYVLLVLLLIVNQVCPRRLVFLTGLWSVFPIAVHSAFVFDQRFAYASVPLLCVVWAQAAHALITGMSLPANRLAGTG